MTKKHKLNINGAEYTLVMDFNAMIVIEEETGINPLNVDFENISPKWIAGMLYGSLQAYHSNITMKDVREMITFENLATIVEGVSQAFAKAMPEQENENQKSSEKKIEKSSK